MLYPKGFESSLKKLHYLYVGFWNFGITGIAHIFCFLSEQITVELFIKNLESKDVGLNPAVLEQLGNLQNG